MDHPKAIGDRSALAAMLALQEAGFAIFLPFGENTRCDLVIDDGVRLARVQCKTGRLRGGAVRFNACSTYAHHPHPKVIRRHYLSDVDYFAVYCPETSGAYLVPIEELAVTREGALRVEPPRNGQKRGIRLASAYEVATVSARAKATLGASAGG